MNRKKFLNLILKTSLCASVGSFYTPFDKNIFADVLDLNDLASLKDPSLVRNYQDIEKITLMYKAFLESYSNHCITGADLYLVPKIQELIQCFEMFARTVGNIFEQVASYYALQRDNQNVLAQQSFDDLLKLEKILVCYDFAYIRTYDIFCSLVSCYKLNHAFQAENSLPVFNFVHLDDKIMILNKQKRQQLYDIWIRNGMSFNNSNLTEFSSTARQEGISVGFSWMNALVFDLFKDSLSENERINSLGIKTGSSIRQVDFGGALWTAEVAETHYGNFAVTEDKVFDTRSGKSGKIAAFNDKNGEIQYVIV